MWFLLRCTKRGAKNLKIIRHVGQLIRYVQIILHVCNGIIKFNTHIIGYVHVCKIFCVLYIFLRNKEYKMHFYLLFSDIDTVLIVSRNCRLVLFLCM